MQRCIQIAKNGLGTTQPNPMVGCVIVHNNVIIGEGYTSSYGGNHAEVNAIRSVVDTSLLKDATLYVTLEPCSHFGKTPPCANFIIKNNIKKVIIGCVDSNPKVAGKGIKILQEAGCKVVVGVLEEACKIHHKRFFTFQTKKRPYIILKWAATKNGFIAPKEKKHKKPVWISNTYSRQLTHKWRAQEQAILVGKNTILQDNPSLTTRNYKGNNPIRIVIDSNNDLDKNYAVFSSQAKTIVLQEKQPKSICQELYKLNINSVIIEGGTKTLQRFITANYWDEARVFIGNSYFKEGIKAPVILQQPSHEITIQKDFLLLYYNQQNKPL